MRDPPAQRLLPTPRVVAVRGKPRLYQLLDYEVGPYDVAGVRGVHARKLACLCGYEGAHLLCETRDPPLPARAPRWTAAAADDGLVSCAGLLARGGGGALPALARLCAARGSSLTVHTPPLPSWMRTAPNGFLAAALATGVVQLIEHPSAASYQTARQAAASAPNFVPPECAWANAEPGVAALARAIGAWWRTRPGGGLDVPRARETSRALDVVLPAGSGTAALFLARHVPTGVHVHAVPCKGDAASLLSRMESLDAATGGHGALPAVLSPPPTHAARFGTVQAPLLEAWRDAAQSGVLLDLVYGPVAWAAMEGCEWQPSRAAPLTTEHGNDGGGAPVGERDVLYVNMGGHEGLESQMRRYQRAGHLRRVGGGEWAVEEVLSGARRVAARTAGLVHTRDAGL